MQIVYCDTCGKRITDATQAHQDGDRWICVTCRPATSAAAPVEDDPERARSTVMVERLNGSPATSSQARRRTLPTGGPRGGVGPQPPQVKSPVALYAAAGVGVLLLGVVGLALMSGKSAPATVTSTSANGSSGGTGANPSPAPAHSSSSGQALTPAPAVPSTPNPSPAPSPATPVPPAPVPATPNPSPAPPPVPDPVRPSANKEGEARAKFTPLKAEFDRAKSANDLKTMARVAGDMGMISRDYDGTATATEALAVIKLFNEIKAADRIREASMEFRKAKGAAKEYNDEVAEAIANLRKIAKEMNGTTAAAEAETDIKNYLEGEAGRHWNRAKGKTTGDTPEAAAACDLAAKVAREFAGTDVAKEADKALADEEKRLLETRGTSAFLVLQSGLWHARDPRTVRDIVNQAHSLLDSGEGDEALNGLIERALKVLEDFTTPAARTKPAFGWQNAAAIKKDFYAIDGSKGDLIKEADNKGAIKFTSAGPAVRVMVALMHTEEDSVLKLNYKVQGIKNLTLRFVSTTYRQTFEYKVPNLKNDAAEALALPLATVKKDKASLHNAYVSILEIRGEKAKADDAAAAILLYSGDLTSGRAK